MQRSIIIYISCFVNLLLHYLQYIVTPPTISEIKIGNGKCLHTGITWTTSHWVSRFALQARASWAFLLHTTRCTSLPAVLCSVCTQRKDGFQNCTAFKLYFFKHHLHGQLLYLKWICWMLCFASLTPTFLSTLCLCSSWWSQLSQGSISILNTWAHSFWI